MQDQVTSINDEFEIMIDNIHRSQDNIIHPDFSELQVEDIKISQKQDGLDSLIPGVGSEELKRKVNLIKKHLRLYLKRKKEE